MASARVAGLSSMPRTADVTVRDPGLRTPRIDMHRCSASTTTMTPRGSRMRMSASAIWDVNRSCTWGALGVDVDEPGELGQPGQPALLAGDVARRAPPVERHQVVLAGGVQLDVADEDQLVVTDLERRRQHVLRLLEEPGEHLRVGRATRAGVSRNPSRSGSSPIPTRISRTAACNRAAS